MWYFPQNDKNHTPRPYTIGCPNCGGRSQRYGRRHKRQRYRCLGCKHIFQRKHKHFVVSYSDFKAFRRYVVKGTDQETLCHELGISRQELSERFNWFLCLPPCAEVISQINPPLCHSPSTPWVYGYDAKWISRSPILLVHRDVLHKQPVWWSVAKNESRAAVYEDLPDMTRSVVAHPPVGIVTDGKPGIAQVIKDIFGVDRHQRCLVHVVRDLKKYLPLRSPIEATRELRVIALRMHHINSKTELVKFQSSLTRWHEKYGYLLDEISRPLPNSGSTRKWWYTHGTLRRAWKLMTNDPSTLFAYLEDNRIPKTNNSLEGVNRHLLRKVGTSKLKQLSLMIWKIAFARIQTKSQEKLLWGLIKERL